MASNESTDVDKLANSLVRQLIDMGAACQKARSFSICTSGTPMRSVYDVYTEKVARVLRALPEFEK